MFGISRATAAGLGAAIISLALVSAPAFAALPRTYQVQRIDSPNPQPNGLFGIGMIGHSDLNGDGADDVLVPQTGSGPNSDGQIFVFSGATGALIDTINAPDRGNPTGASGNSRAGFGLFTSTIADLGSCPGGSSAAGCATPSAAKDGVDEIVTGATGIDIPTAGADEDATPADDVAEDIGRAYVIDGATRAVLKRIDMPAADRLQHATFPAGAPNPHTPSFGRVVLAPAGLPPCAGNFGIGPCAPVSREVAIGDMDGAGLADLVIGAPTYDETSASNPACSPGQCHEAGRTYVYRGEDMIDPAHGGAAPADALETPLRTLRSIVAQTDDELSSARTNSELFGQAIFPIGDVGGCTSPISAGELCPNSTSTSTPDGSPEVVVSAFRTDLPSNADVPDPAFFDVGVNMLVDGRTGSVLAIYQHPEPQAGSIFGFTLHNEPAPGDLGSTPAPDVFIPAMRQNVDFTAQGRGYIMNGNFKAGANSLNFAQLNDPTPVSGGNFGVSSAGVGNLVSDEEGAPRNELLVGAFGPHNPGTNVDIINDIHIFNPVTERVLQTIPDPDQQPGSSFGTAVSPLGDLNGDGFLDIAVAADLWSSPTTRRAGRFYILRSDNSPPPAGGGAPGAAGGGAPGGGAAAAPVTPNRTFAAVERFPAKLQIRRSRMQRAARRLDVLAPITRLASGEVKVELFAAQRRFRFNQEIDDEAGRVRFLKPIPKAQAELGTGIVTITYPGDADTRPGGAPARRLGPRKDRAGPSDAGQRQPVRPRHDIRPRARGGARPAQYVSGGKTTTVKLRGQIRNGRWSIDERLSQQVLEGIAQRTGTVHSYILFTGYLPRRIRGEMQSFQVLGPR
ncbi:MAG: integrin alpha [Actinobacteria bacterium]|nr:integrin alpha [Actinomycetota bacterium]